MMRLSIFLSITFYLLLAVSAAHAKQRDWHEYSSTNFKIYTDEKQDKAKKILTDFEKFRMATLRVTGLEDRPENSRMMILLYTDKKEFAKLQPGKHVAGFYMNPLAGPRMVIGPGSRALDINVILYHEYVHYLVREHTDVRYPKWYDEGFAELLASATIKDKNVIIGGVHPLRAGWLRNDRTMSVKQLLSPKDEATGSSYWGRYYAASWIFTHYLQMGHFSGKTDYRDASLNLLTRINNGEDAESSFTEEFGMSTRDMDRELHRYMQRGSLMAINITVGDYEGKIAARKLPLNEKLHILADMVSMRGEEKEAIKYLQAMDGTQADAARALSLLAVLENHDQLPTAETHLLKALAYAPDDDEVLANATHFYWDSYTQAEAEEASTQAFEKLLGYGEKAIAVNPLNLEAHSFLWSAYQKKGERINALKSMMAAYPSNSTNIALNYILGTYLFEGQSKHLARSFIERVLAWSHNEKQLTHAQEILDALDKIAASQAAATNTDSTE